MAAAAASALPALAQLLAPSVARQVLPCLRGGPPSLEPPCSLASVQPGGGGFTLNVPYAELELAWEVFFDPTAVPLSPPDFCFPLDDDGFVSLAPQAACAAAALAAGGPGGHGAGSASGAGAALGPAGSAAAAAGASLAARLLRWQPSDASALRGLITELRAAYAAHQRLRLAALRDDRVAFELSTIGDTPGLQVLLLPAGGAAASGAGISGGGFGAASAAAAAAREARFVLPLEIEAGLAAQLARPLHAALAALGRAGEAPGGTAPGAHDAAAAAGRFHGGAIGAALSLEVDAPQPTARLSLGFPLGPAAAGSPPSVSLSLPPRWREALMGAPLALPPWTSQQCGVEFIPLAAAEASKQLAAAAGALVSRGRLLLALAEALGEAGLAVSGAAESLFGNAWTPAGSAGGPAGPSAAAAVELDAARCLSIAFAVSLGGCRVLLRVRLTAGYPTELPRLAVHSLTRREPPPANTPRMVAFTDFPWSPRWDAREQARRVLAFLGEHVPAWHQALPL